jgi:hypothetical protein
MRGCPDFRDSFFYFVGEAAMDHCILKTEHCCEDTDRFLAGMDHI